MLFRSRKGLARNLLASVHKGQPLIVTDGLGLDVQRMTGGVVLAESIGHDLSYGTTSFLRPLRSVNVPNVDPDTGEIMPSGTAAGAEESSVDDESVEEESTEGSYEPAF